MRVIGKAGDVVIRVVGTEGVEQQERIEQGVAVGAEQAAADASGTVRMLSSGPPVRQSPRRV